MLNRASASENRSENVKTEATGTYSHNVKPIVILPASLSLDSGNSSSQELQPLADESPPSSAPPTMGRGVLQPSVAFPAVSPLIVSVASNSEGRGNKRHQSVDAKNKRYSGLANAKLTSASSVEDSISLHLSTASLSSSTSSSSDAQAARLFPGHVQSNALNTARKSHYGVNEKAEDLSKATATSLLPKKVKAQSIDLPSASQQNESSSSSQTSTDQKELTKSRYSATGAIPKSISFDKTAEQGDRELSINDTVDSKNKKSFFRNLFKGRRKVNNFSNSNSLEEVLDGRLNTSRPATIAETSDEILAKYRAKSPQPTDGGAAKLVQEASDKLNMVGPEEQSSGEGYLFNVSVHNLRSVLSDANCLLSDVDQVGNSQKLGRFR